MESDEVMVKRAKLAQALGIGLRSYFMSQFVPGAAEADVDYECVTEGAVTTVRCRLSGVNSKRFKTVRLELHLDHTP